MIEKYELGVCVVPEYPHVWSQRIPTDRDWAEMAACGVTLVRMAADPAIGCPTRDMNEWWGGATASEFDAAKWDKDWKPWSALLRRWAEPTLRSGMRLQINMANRRPDWAKDDPNFFFRAARSLAGKSRFWSCAIDSFSFGNEPGADGGEPTIETGYLPALLQFSEGIRSALPFNAVLAGPDADSDSVLARILRLEGARFTARPPLACIDRISIHPYGDVRKAMGYATMDAFLAASRQGDYRPIDVTEIGGQGGDDVGDETSQMLFDWYVATTAKYPQIKRHYLLDPRYLTEGHTWTYSGQPDPKASALGRKFAAHVAALNGVEVAPAPPSPGPEPVPAPPPPVQPPPPQPAPAPPAEETVYFTEVPAMPDTSKLNPSWDYVVRYLNGHFAIGQKGASVSGFPPAGAVEIWPVK